MGEENKERIKCINCMHYDFTLQYCNRFEEHDVSANDWCPCYEENGGKANEDCNLP